MAYYFGFALPGDHQQQLDDLITSHGQGSYSSSEEISRLALLGVDGVVKVLALDVIEILKGDKEGGSLLDIVAKLVTSTMHVLLRQLLGKVSNPEQDQLAAYMLRRRIDAPQGRLFGYQMPDDAGQRLQKVLQQAIAQDADQHAGSGNVREELINAMNLFIDLTTQYCYDEFAACLDLGFVKRKLVDVSRSTIQKAGHTTVRKLLTRIDDTQIRAVSLHYQHMLLTF